MHYLAINLIICITIILPAIALGQHEDAPAPIQLSVTLCNATDVILAGEPIIARVELRNTSNDIAHVLIGNELFSTTRMCIFNSIGVIVAETPGMPKIRTGLVAMSILKPSECVSNYWIITGLFNFATPGEYTICFQYEDSEVRESLIIAPTSQEQIEERCDELFRMMTSSKSGSRPLPFGVYVKALYSVRHNAVIPYLDWMARNWNDRYACRTLRRINSQQSNAVLQELALRQDAVGKAARQASTMETNLTMWDIIAN